MSERSRFASKSPVCASARRQLTREQCFGGGTLFDPTTEDGIVSPDAPTRRALLASSAGALAGIGGCSSVGIFGDDSPGPAAVVEQFFEALLDRQWGDAGSYLHPESHFGDLDPRVLLWQFPDSHLSFQRARRDESVDEPVVRASLTTEYRGETHSYSQRYMLGRSDGSWRIRCEYPCPPEGFPQVAWETTERCQEVVFEHALGDAVDTRSYEVTADVSRDEARLPPGTLERGDVLSVYTETDPIPEATMAVEVTNVAWYQERLSIEWYPDADADESYSIGSFALRAKSDPHYPDSCTPTAGEE